MRRNDLSWLVIAGLLLASCAATSYGIDPKAVPNSADTYNFTVFFNAFTTDAHIDRDAEAQIANFKPKHGYKGHEVTNRECSRVTGKCTFTVHFTR
jgi:hypothetical protein